MSIISHATALRSFAVTGVLTLAALAVPRPSHAQSGYADRALLNRIPPSWSDRSVRLPQLAVLLPVNPGTVSGEAVSGARALLARTPDNHDLDPAATPQPTVTPAEPVDGARALLGRIAQ